MHTMGSETDNDCKSVGREIMNDTEKSNNSTTADTESDVTTSILVEGTASYTISVGDIVERISLQHEPEQAVEMTAGGEHDLQHSSGVNRPDESSTEEDGSIQSHVSAASILQSVLVQAREKPREAKRVTFSTSTLEHATDENTHIHGSIQSTEGTDLLDLYRRSAASWDHFDNRPKKSKDFNEIYQFYHRDENENESRHDSLYVDAHVITDRSSSDIDELVGTSMQDMELNTSTASPQSRLSQSYIAPPGPQFMPGMSKRSVSVAVRVKGLFSLRRTRSLSSLPFERTRQSSQPLCQSKRPRVSLLNSFPRFRRTGMPEDQDCLDTHATSGFQTTSTPPNTPASSCGSLGSSPSNSPKIASQLPQVSKPSSSILTSLQRRLSNLRAKSHSSAAAENDPPQTHSELPSPPPSYSAAPVLPVPIIPIGLDDAAIDEQLRDTMARVEAEWVLNHPEASLKDLEGIVGALDKFLTGSSAM